jgi:integral membrane sensor domain MASE1
MTAATRSDVRAVRVSPPGAFVATLVGAVLAAEISWRVLGTAYGAPSVWLPNGIVVAALVLTHLRAWPWIVAGGMVAEAVTSVGHGIAPAWALAYTVPNACEVLLAAGLFRRWQPDRTVTTRRGLAAFTMAAVAIGPAVGAGLGTVVVALDPNLSGSSWPGFVYWWVGDALGMLMIAALALAWVGPAGRDRRGDWRDWVVVLVLVLGVSGVLAVTGDAPFGYLSLVVLVAAAARLGVRGVLTYGCLLAVLLHLMTIQGYGIWATIADGPLALAYVSAFLVVAILTTWLFAVEANERERAQAREAEERQARQAVEHLAGRLARLRALGERLSAVTSEDEVRRAWLDAAPAALGGLRQVLHLQDGRSAPLAVAGRSAADPVEVGAVSAVAEGDAVAAVCDLDSGRVTVAAAMIRNRVTGAVTVTYEEDVVDDAATREAVAAAAGLVADALARAALFADAAVAGERVARLQRLTSALARAATTRDVAATITGVAAEIVGASACGVLVADRHARRLVPASATGPPPDGLVVAEVGILGTGHVSEVGRSRRPLYGGESGDPITVGEPANGPRGEVRWLLLPLVVADRLRGVAWFSWPTGHLVSEDDRAFHLAVAGQCAASLRRAAATEGEHDAAVQLQRALLPQRFPSITGLAAAARYLPSSEGLSVGGDWYDVVARPDGRGAIVVGDVVGHDVTAAAAMGQLRSAMTAIVVESADPGAALVRLDAYPTGDDIGFVTVLQADFDPVSLVVRYACAGHPPPLLVGRSGEARFLMDGRSGPLFATSGPRPFGTVRAASGSLLICYTDGLIERPDRSLYDGMTALARACLTHRGLALPAMADQIVSDLVGGRPLVDDVALLVVALNRAPGRRPVRTGRSARPAGEPERRPARQPTRA